MSQPFMSPEIHQLLEALLNEEITTEQQQRLEALLAGNSTLQNQYLAYVDFHLELKKIVVCDSEFQSVEADQDTHVARQTEMTPTSGVRSAGWSSSQLQRFRPGIPVAAATLLTALVMALTVNYWKASPLLQPLTGATQQNSAATDQLRQQQTPQIPAPQPVAAVLTQAAGAELMREIVPELQSPMQIGHEYVLLKGMVELQFANGATTILQSPAIFTIESAERLDLKVGNCSVHAPESAKGFEVITPRSRVVDLGTRFSVNVSDAGSSDVQVVEGAAEVHLNNKQAEMATLVKGEASRATGALEGLQSIQFTADQYQRSLPDRVISYEAEPVGYGNAVRDLASVTVQRGGQVIEYPVDDLIGIDILHFAAHSHRGNVALDSPEIPENVLDLLTKDRALNTGLINFNRNSQTSSEAPIPSEDFRLHPGLAVQFQRPVRNDPGPDVVLFEIQSVCYPPEGDSFRVCPLQSSPELHSHVIEKFDITLNSKNARRIAPFYTLYLDTAATSSADLRQDRLSMGETPSLAFYALAVGVDLSDLGYAEGAEVSELLFEDSSVEPNIDIDPVFIGGFPPIQ